LHSKKYKKLIQRHLTFLYFLNSIKKSLKTPLFSNYRISSLAKTFGIYSAILAIIFGNLLLLAMGIVLASSSATHRKSTAETAIDVFGLKGKELFSGAMVISMIGWFSIQLNIMTSAFQNMLNPEMIICLNIVLGIAITLVGIKGMRILTALATFSMPFLIITNFMHF